MIEIRQHIPAFIENDEPKTERIESVADLESIEWIQAWQKQPGFHRFSMSREYGDKLLLAEFEKGARWWVVARLNADLPELPTWVRGPIQ